MKTIQWMGVLLCLGVMSCSPTANSVLKNYLDALSKGDGEQAYQYLSAEDRAAVTIEQFKSLKLPESGTPFFDFMAKNSTYEIASTIKDGDHIKAEITVKIPDPSQMLMELSMGSIGKSKEEVEADAFKVVDEKLKKGKLPFKSETEWVELIKEHSDWKVYLDLKTLKAESDKRIQLLVLEQEAKEAEQADLYDKALQKYQAQLKERN